MIKGRYVATVEILFNIDENTEGLLPFEQVKEKIETELTPSIQEVLEDEIGEDGVVCVRQNCVDVYLEES